jgi:hypothetical protein
MQAENLSFQAADSAPPPRKLFTIPKFCKRNPAFREGQLRAGERHSKGRPGRIAWHLPLARHAPVRGRSLAPSRFRRYDRAAEVLSGRPEGDRREIGSETCFVGCCERPTHDLRMGTDEEIGQRQRVRVARFCDDSGNIARPIG